MEFEVAAFMAFLLGFGAFFIYQGIKKGLCTVWKVLTYKGKAVGIKVVEGRRGRRKAVRGRLKAEKYMFEVKGKSYLSESFWKKITDKTPESAMVKYNVSNPEENILFTSGVIATAAYYVILLVTGIYLVILGLGTVRAVMF